MIGCASAAVVRLPIQRAGKGSSMKPFLVNPALTAVVPQKQVIHIQADGKDYVHDQNNHVAPIRERYEGQPFVNITIGSPAQQYEVLVDTGGVSFLWMPVIDCSAGVPVNCRDTVAIGDLVIEDQAFADRDLLPIKFGFDGILGLSNTSLKNKPASPFSNMIAQGLLDEPVFSLYMSNSTSNSSELIFGGIDQSHFSGDLIRLPLRKEESWQVELDAITSGTISIKFRGTGAVFDSATSGIAMPRQAAEELHEAMGEVNCDDRGSLPDLTFTLASQNFSLSPYEYIVKNRDDECSTVIEALDIPIEAGGPLVILGDAFFRKWYSVYNAGDPSISLAAAK